MANSKANIYPIQLQGAELNLNKFDAEIKQYSGFNKNNSPFVGGCLSNIFVKSASMGNGNNIYIDNNGDIFQCNVNIFKNNKSVFPNIDGSNRLFFCDELEVDAEYVFNENLLMNLSLSGSRYSFRINSHNCGSLPIDYAGIQEAIEKNLFSYCFGGNFFVFANYTTQNRINVNIFKSTGEFISSFYINTSAFSDFPVIKIVFTNSKWLLFYVDENGNQVVDCYTIGNSGVTEFITGISSVKISSYQTTPVELSDIRNYIPVGLYSNRLYFKGDLSSKNSDTILTYVYNSSLISNNSLVITPLENQTVLSNSEIVAFSSKINKNGILSADLQYKKNGINYFYHLNSYKAANYGFQVKKTLSGYTGEYVLGHQNYLDNNISLLFNNNNFFGI